MALNLPRNKGAARLGKLCPQCNEVHRSCTGHNSKGKPCGRWRILGGTVCPKHGGSTPAVKEAAKRRMAEAITFLMDKNGALQEASRIADSDIRKVFTDDGQIKPIHEWPEEIARCISGAEVVKRNVDSGDGKIDDVLKIKLWDKMKALELLFKYHGLLKEQVEHSGAVTYRWLRVGEEEKV